jgi:hypothetical protein
LVYGAVPGPNGGYVVIQPTNKLPMRKGTPVVREAAEEKTEEKTEDGEKES